MNEQQETTHDPETPETPEQQGTATYCPEDDKIRLYIGRVPRDEYERLRAAGFTALHKQRDAGGGDFVATWTPSREDMALEYSGGILEDEDAGPQERAADRAERFSGYRDKREGEALQLADRYDSGPAVHGYQSQALAERRAARHDLQASRAVNTWDKAEYWQRRTAGVIAHALHKAAPGVRMGRIKTIEAEIRGAEKTNKEAAERYAWVRSIAADPAAAVVAYAPRCPRYYIGKEPEPETAAETFQRVAVSLADSIVGTVGHIQHPRKPDLAGYVSALMIENQPDPLTLADVCAWYLSRHADPATGGEGRWLRHLRLRLEYENQMLEAQGGRAAHVEMIPGGWLGNKQIQKVNKSPATGRVVSVAVWGKHTIFTKESGYQEQATLPVLLTIKTERLAAEVYRAPTDEERAAFLEGQKAAKKEAAKTAPKAPPLINPTDEDAAKVQAVWNERKNRGRASWQGDASKEVLRMTQAQYSAASQGGYSRFKTLFFRADWEDNHVQYCGNSEEGAAFKLRVTGYDPYQVIVLTDKPRKPVPAMVEMSEGVEA